MDKRISARHAVPVLLLAAFALLAGRDAREARETLAAPVGATAPAVYGAYSVPMPGLRFPLWPVGRPLRVPSSLEIKAADRHFALYYGWPSVVNGSAGNVEAAVAAFARFPVVIFGDALHHNTHPDHERTAAIIRGLRAGGDIRVFGYVDLGVSTQNLSIATVLRYAEQWQRIGASGIFLDDAGADFGVETARRDAAVAGIHGMGMRVILNAHDPEDAFRGSARLGSGDGYLLESFQVSDGRLLPPEASLAKADHALELAQRSGVDVYAVATGPPDDPGFDTKYEYAWWSTLLYGFDFFQYTTIDYGSLSGQLRWYPQDLPDLGTRYVEEVVQHAWTESLHRRQTDWGEIRLSTGSVTAGAFVPREPTLEQSEELGP